LAGKGVRTGRKGSLKAILQELEGRGRGTGKDVLWLAGVIDRLEFNSLALVTNGGGGGRGHG
jgi:hypothetical protein